MTTTITITEGTILETPTDPEIPTAVPAPALGTTALGTTALGTTALGITAEKKVSRVCQCG